MGLECKTFEVECRGRCSDCREVLSEPVNVKVDVFSPAYSGRIETIVRCAYVCGDYPHECSASYSGRFEKNREPAYCPFSIILPDAKLISEAGLKEALRRR